MSDFVVENDNSLKLNVVECIAGGGGGCNIYDGKYNPPPLADIIKQKMFGDQFFLGEKDMSMSPFWIFLPIS